MRQCNTIRFCHSKLFFILDNRYASHIVVMKYALLNILGNSRQRPVLATDARTCKTVDNATRISLHRSRIRKSPKCILEYIIHYADQALGWFVIMFLFYNPKPIEHLSQATSRSASIFRRFLSMYSRTPDSALMPHTIYIFSWIRHLPENPS